jgi:hypothetical protein
MIVGAVDQDGAHAHLAHVAEGDLLRPHAAIKAAASVAGKLSILAGQDAGEPLPVAGVGNEARRFTPGGAVRRFMVNSIFCDSRRFRPR